MKQGADTVLHKIESVISRLCQGNPDNHMEKKSDVGGMMSESETETFMYFLKQ